MWRGDCSTRDQQLLVGHLMMVSSLTESSVKARELEVQPQAESQMNRIACPQRRRLGQAEMGCGVEIHGCQGQRLQAILSQQAKPPPGFLGFFKRDRPAARLESKGRSQFRTYPGRDKPGLARVRLQKQGGIKVNATQ